MSNKTTDSSKNRSSKKRSRAISLKTEDSDEEVEITKTHRKAAFTMAKKNIALLRDSEIHDMQDKFMAMEPENQIAVDEKEKVLLNLKLELRKRHEAPPAPKKEAPKKKTLAEVRAETKKKEAISSAPPAMVNEIKDFNKTNKDNEAKEEEVKQEDPKLEYIVQESNYTVTQAKDFLAQNATSMTYVVADLLEGATKHSMLINCEGLQDNYKQSHDEIVDLWGQIALQHPYILNSLAGPKVRLSVILGGKTIKTISANNKDQLAERLANGYDSIQSAKANLMAKVRRKNEELGISNTIDVQADEEEEEVEDDVKKEKTQ